MSFFSTTFPGQTSDGGVHRVVLSSKFSRFECARSKTKQWSLIEPNIYLFVKYSRLEMNGSTTNSHVLSLPFFFGKETASILLLVPHIFYRTSSMPQEATFTELSLFKGGSVNKLCEKIGHLKIVRYWSVVTAVKYHDLISISIYHVWYVIYDIHIPLIFIFTYSCHFRNPAPFGMSKKTL